MKFMSRLCVAAPLKAAAICVLLLAPVMGRAQSYGSLVGTVSDTTGAAIPRAVVTVTNRATGDRRVENTNGDGAYRFINLLPGEYREDVEMSGFKHFTREPITVDVETTFRVDVPLTVGAVSESVEVTGATPLLQTDSATLQTVVDGKTVEEMPLNGKNVLNLIALTPGVVAQGSTAGASGSNQSAGHTNSTGWNNYQIGGGMPGQSAQFLDGAPTTGLGGNQVFLIANQDSVGEFRVATAAVSPEFGRFGGGVVSFITKSGGNDLHGSAYEYFRNKVLNTTPYFTKLTGAAKPSFNQNQFGGSLGGKIIRDKAFFFLNYEQYKLISGGTVTALVPTAAERSGDFSADAPIYDPYTTVLTGDPQNPVTRTQFPGNKIPSNRFDATGNAILNVLQYYPLPNTTAGGPVYNYANTTSPGVQSYQGVVRVDYNVSSKQHFFARYSQWDLTDIPQNQYSNLTGGAGSSQITKQGVLGDSYSFSPKLTGDVRLSYGRGFSDDAPPSLGRDLSVYGPAYSSLSSLVTARMNVGLNVNGFGPLMGMTNFDSQYRNTIAISPSGTYFMGQHTLQFGADLRFMDFNYVIANNASGAFSFDNSFTSANGSANASTGNAIASLLLGTPSSGSLNTAIETGQYTWYQGYYIADNWKATRTLAVNLGIRYELPGAWYERRDRNTVLLPNAANGLGTVGGYNLKGGLFLVNSSNWNSRASEQVKHNLFSPRAGVAYNPTRDTVFRAGYSLTYIPFDAYDGASPSNSPINVAITNMVSSVNNNTYQPLNTLSDPFPAGGVPGTVQQAVLQAPGRNQSYLDSLAGLSITGPVPVTRFPYNQQWTASIQQQFIGQTVLQIAYAGNRGTFLPLGANYQTGSTNNLNQLPDQYDSLAGALSAPVANPFAGNLNSTGSLNGPTINAGQLLRPFPQYSNVIQANAKGDSIYHAMLITFQKRFAHGGQINSNYTWSKVIGNVAGSPFGFLESGMLTTGDLQDFTNLRADRSVLNTSVPNRFVTSFVAPLPFGHGRMFMSNTGNVVGGFVNGWEVNGIVTFQTGYNLSLATSGNALSQSFGAGTIRPNYVQGCKKQISGPAQSRLNQWFNASCFVSPGNYSFGNEPRVDGDLHAAGVANYDASVSKNTGITDRLSLQLKAEIFNVFNRVQFAPPNTTIGRGPLGAVSSAVNQPRQIQLSGRFVF